MLPLYSEDISLTRPVHKRVKVPKVVVESAEIFDDALMGGAFFRDDVVFGGQSCLLEGEALPRSDTLTCPQLSSEDFHTKDSIWQQELPPMCQIINEVIGPPWWSGDAMHMPRIPVPTAGLLELDTQVELVQSHMIHEDGHQPGSRASLLHLKDRVRRLLSLPEAPDAQIQAQSESAKMIQHATCHEIVAREPYTDAHPAVLPSTWPWRGDRIYPLTGIDTSDAIQLLPAVPVMPLHALADIGVNAVGCVIGSDTEALETEVFKQVRVMCAWEPEAVCERHEDEDKMQLKCWPRVQSDPPTEIAPLHTSVQLEPVSSAVCAALSAHIKIMTPLSLPLTHESVTGSTAGVSYGAFIPMHKQYRALEALVNIVSTTCPMHMMVLPPPEPLILAVPPDMLVACKRALQHVMVDERCVLSPQDGRNIMLHSMRQEYLRLHLPDKRRRIADQSRDVQHLLPSELNVTCAETKTEVGAEMGVNAEAGVEADNTEMVLKLTFYEMSAAEAQPSCALPAPQERIQAPPPMPSPPPSSRTATPPPPTGSECMFSLEREGQIPLLELFRQMQQELGPERPTPVPIPVEENSQAEEVAQAESSVISPPMLQSVRWQEEQPWYPIDDTQLERMSCTTEQQSTPRALLRPLPPTAIEEAGLQVLVSEAQFEASPWLVTELARSHGIRCVDVQLEEPLALVVDGHTGVALLSHDMGADRAALKQIVKALTKVAFKFRVIWLLVVQVNGNEPGSPASYQDQQKRLAYASGYYTGLCQSLSQFPCRVVLRHCSSDTLAEQVAAVCADAQEEAQIGFNISSTAYFHRPLFAALERGEAIVSGIDCISSCPSSASKHSTATVLPQHCQFLQLLPTMNFYSAAELLACWPLHELVTLPADELIARAPLQLPNPNAIRDMCALLGRHIGMRCNTRRNMLEHRYGHAPIPPPALQVTRRAPRPVPAAQISPPPTAAAWAKPGARLSPEPVLKAGLKGSVGRPLQYYLPPGGTETQTKLVFK